MSKQKQKVNEFHRHLDGCTHCRNNPLGLCPIGQRLLAEAISMPGVHVDIEFGKEKTEGEK